MDFPDIAARPNIFTKTVLIAGRPYKQWVVIVVALLLLVGLGVGGYYGYQAIWGKKKKKNKKTKETPPAAAQAAPPNPGVSTCTGNCIVDPTTGFQTFRDGTMGPLPKSCYEGSVDADYTHLGSYVKPRYMINGCITESCGNNLSSASRCKKVGKPGYATANGLSSGDTMFPGPDEACGTYCDMDYSRYDPCSIGQVACDPCKIKQDCSVFADTVIDEPRDLAFLEGLRGDATFLTTNFNQSRDLRGDLPVGIPQCALHCNPGDCDACCFAPSGASMTTHGAFLATRPTRTFVY